MLNPRKLSYALTFSSTFYNCCNTNFLLNNCLKTGWLVKNSTKCDFKTTLSLLLIQLGSYIIDLHSAVLSKTVATLISPAATAAVLSPEILLSSRFPRSLKVS